MKTITKFGLVDVISEGKKDIFNFHRTSGRHTYEVVFRKGKAFIKNAYWRYLSFGGQIKGDQGSLWKKFNNDIKKYSN